MSKASPDYTCIQGTTSPIWSISLDGHADISSLNYSATMKVVHTLGGDEEVETPTINKKDDDTGWQAWLTGEQTESLKDGHVYYIIFRIENSEVSPPVEEEVQKTLKILPKG